MTSGAETPGAETPASPLRTALRIEGERLTGRCDPAMLPFETTDSLIALDAVFGQERAVRAIEFALGMAGQGYNLYASGPDGIGKSTVVESFLRRRAEQLPPPPDWIYVRNFRDTDRPIGIGLPAGEGRVFAASVEQTVERAIEELTTAFESDTYVRQRGELAQQVEQRRAALLEGLSQQAAEAGFQMQMTPTGIVSAPLIEGAPVTDEVFQALPQEQKDDIQARAQALEVRVQDSMLAMRALERDAEEGVEQLDEQVATFAINHLFGPLLEQHVEDREIIEFLEAVRDDLRHERRHLVQAQGQAPAPAPFGPGASPAAQQELIRRRYLVNLFVQHDAQRGAPVVFERHPTYYNLMGRTEYVGQLGTMVSDHTLVKAGSLARAAGGFLIVRLRDLLQNQPAYDGLKRALNTQELAIENLGESYGLVPTTAQRPEPMPLDVKVAIVGDAGLYGLLYRLDPDFRELFRVKADFEVDVPRNEQNIHGLASLVRRHTVESGLRSFSRDAVARVVEHGSRIVEDQSRVSADMGAFLDVLRQADYWAGRAGAATVDADHVTTALEEREYRSSLVRDRIQQLIEDGTFFIDTAGAKTGQINALSVYDLGDISFGRPSRITCVVSAGRGTVINVERETSMAGRLHNKGFLIVRGFLAHRFGQDKALALHASLTFEQLYGDIDGDSASSTEVYALLSALAQVPIDQGIAVTGSVNQRGEVQPIGGATAKIEGFYDVCAARGLTGRQGVMIPATNVDNVVLRPEVAAAIEAGQFHVWAIATIEHGIEVLTGVPAGERAEDGRYPEGTVYRLAEDRLDEFYHVLSDHQDVGTTNGATPAATPLPIAPPQPGIPPEPPPEPPIIVGRP